MSEPKFTKGTWKIAHIDDKYHVLKFETGFGICNTVMNEDADLQNAHLIAAAPEMYKFLDDLANGRGVDYPIEQLLAKARGEK